MNIAEKYADLASRLSAFGNDLLSSKALTLACADNSWFSEADVKRAVDAIRTEMLQPDKLSEWFAAYNGIPVSTPRNVLIVMAGNIPAVGFFDLLCVTACGHNAIIKPSQRDRALIEYIADVLHKEFHVSFYDDTVVPDAIIAMGNDNFIRSLDAEYDSLPKLLRGSRSSAAVLDGQETESDLYGLADDMMSFSGLGCRNVSLLFVPRGYDFSSLSRIAATHQTSKGWHNNYIQKRAMAIMNGMKFIDTGNVLIAKSSEFPTSIGEVHYAEYDSPTELTEILAQRDAEIQCVACNIDLHKRCVRFGMTQLPALSDYPDGIDTMLFLLSI